MSHSQFHSTKLFILRHAWLNLWDKHMTTGRINQVTTIHFALILMAQRPPSQMGVRQTSRGINYDTKPQLRPPCSPDLTCFKHSSPCHTEQQRSWPSEGTTNNRSTKMSTAVIVDSQVANCNRFGYQQVIPHSPLNASTSKVLVFVDQKAK
jgi:hypothetical protein